MSEVRRRIGLLSMLSRRESRFQRGDSEYTVKQIVEKDQDHDAKEVSLDSQSIEGGIRGGTEMEGMENEVPVLAPGEQDIEFGGSRSVVGSKQDLGVVDSDCDVNPEGQAGLQSRSKFSKTFSEIQLQKSIQDEAEAKAEGKNRPMPQDEIANTPVEAEIQSDPAPQLEKSSSKTISF